MNSSSVEDSELIKAEQHFISFLKGTRVLPDPSHPHYRVDYDYIVNRLHAGEEIAENLLEEYPFLQNGKILDVGVGSGGVAVAFARKKCTVYGVDISSDYLGLAASRAREHGVAVDLGKWNGTTLPFHDTVFSLVIMTDILEHVPSPSRLIAEAIRVLVPGGMCFFATENKYSPVFLKADPHYGVPFLTLCPRWMRKLVVVSLLKRSSRLDDYHWFGSVREIAGIFNALGADAFSYTRHKIPHYNTLLSRGGILRFLGAIPFFKNMYLSIILSGIAIKRK